MTGIMIVTILAAVVSIVACIIVVFSRNTTGAILELIVSESHKALRLIKEMDEASARLRLIINESRKKGDRI